MSDSQPLVVPQKEEKPATPPPYPGPTQPMAGYAGYTQQPPVVATGYAPQGPYVTSTVTMAPAHVVTQPVVVQQQQVILCDYPVQVVCPTGGHTVTTNITFKNGQLTYIAAGVLCFFAGIAGIIPFFIDSLKDVEHTCPIDGTVIGVYRRSIGF